MDKEKIGLSDPTKKFQNDQTFPTSKQKPKSSNLKSSSYKNLYVLLVLIRLIIVLTSTSFIHPDEHFQNTEIAVADVFNLNETVVERTWEWKTKIVGENYGLGDTRVDEEVPFGGFAVRSIVPIFHTSHLSLNLLKFLCRFGILKLSTRNLILAPRLTLFLFSILLENLLLFDNSFRKTRSSLVLIFSSSLSSLLFVSRTFSNSFESILISLLIVQSLNIHKQVSQKINGDVSKNGRRKFESSLKLIGWSLLVVLLIFVRISSISFTIPIILTVLFKLLIINRDFEKILIIALSGLMFIFGFVVIDSIYFGHFPSITPLRLLIYNLDRKNLVLHGIHPFWLHLLVNGQIIFGPAIWSIGIFSFFKNLRSFKTQPLEIQMSMMVFCSGTFLLSLQPHQEPRFLLPLSLPLSILVLKSLPNFRPRYKKLFWIFHISHSIVTVILFGYLHQGGLQPAMTNLENFKGIRTLLTFKTFEIPSSLIIPTNKSLKKVKNLCGSSKEELLDELCELIKNNVEVSGSQKDEVWLIAPEWIIFGEGFEGFKSFLELNWRSGSIHLDLDRLDLIIKAGFKNSGLGLWKVNSQKFNQISAC